VRKPAVRRERDAFSRPLGIWLAAVCGLLVAIPVFSEETDTARSAELDEIEIAGVPHRIGYRNRDLGLGGPSTVQQQLEDDDVIRDPIYRFSRADQFFAPWQDTKKRVNQEHDLQLGFDYNILSQGLSASIGTEDGGTGGVLRAYGTWVLTREDDKDFGRLIYNVNHRHKIFADIAPANLGSQAGYIGVTGLLFSDVNLVLVDLNWQQSFNDANTGLIAGRFDPNDYMGVLGYANPWTAFSNLAILLNPSVAFPDGSLGVGAGHRFNDQWYFKASINDANGVITDLKSFKGGAEFFKWAEFGWTPAPDQHYLTNVHAVVWHVDEREQAGIPSAHGIMIGANRTTDDQRWMGFVRAGWSKGIAPIYNETYTVGIVRRVRRNSDEVGVAINWGDPPDSSLGSQTTGEFFYRLQLSKGIAITPSVQLLKDSALNPTEDTIWVWGIRFRLIL
jgi:porin